MKNSMKCMLFSMSTVILLSGCLPNDISKDSAKESKKDVEEVVLKLDSFYQEDKSLSVQNYKDFVSDIILESNFTFTDSEIENKNKDLYNQVGEHIPEKVKNDLIKSAKVELSMQKLIDSAINIFDMPKKERHLYDYTYDILYINTANTEILDTYSEDLFQYLQSENSADNHLDNVFNFEIFNASLSKENQYLYNNSFDLIKNMSIGQIKENTYKNIQGKDIYTIFKLISISNTNPLVKERMIKVELFKTKTFAKSQKDIFINRLKFLDSVSKNINISDDDYKKLRLRLDDFEEKTVFDMNNYITELYITDSYLLNTRFN